jgi:uncharacterized membrane protein YeaQ/YmgE (transglycosylase-associated protein family)
MEVFQLLLLGLAVGVIARLVTPGRHSLGVPLTTLLGVLGTAGGGLLADAVGLDGALRWVIAIGMAVILLLLVEAVNRYRLKRSHP